MNKPSIAKIKSKAKHCAPALATGVIFGAAIGATIIHRKYNPKDKVAIQFPKGVVEHMRETGQGLALDTNEGWFTINYHE